MEQHTKPRNRPAYSQPMFDEEVKAIVKLTNKAPEVWHVLKHNPSPKAIFSHGPQENKHRDKTLERTPGGANQSDFPFL